MDTLDSLSDKIKVLRKERDQVSDELDTLIAENRSKRDQLRDDDQGDSKDSREAISKKITELKEERSKLWSSYIEDQEKFREYELKKKELDKLEYEETRKKQDEERKKRDEERNKQREERRKGDLENERWRRMNPNEELIQTCISISNELKSFLKLKEEKKQSREFDANKEAPQKGLVVLKKADDDWLFGDRTKKAKPAPRREEESSIPKPVPQKKKLTITIFQRRALENIGVELPQFSTDIPETLKKIEQKKKELESTKRTALEVDEEIRQEEEIRSAEEAARQAQQQSEQNDESGEKTSSPTRGRGGDRGGRRGRGRGRFQAGGEEADVAEATPAETETTNADI